MANYLSPGVYTEQVSSTSPVVQPVSTSTMAIVGWTERGVQDTATLITNNNDYYRLFGEYTNDSMVPLSVQAFFANGGTRAYMIRVAPTDSAAGESCITDIITGEVLGTGTGATQTIIATLANVPVKAGSVVIDFAPDSGSPVSGENPMFSPAEGEALVGPFVATLAHGAIESGAVTLHWTEALQAVGTLTMGTNPTAAQVVVLAGKTYTFVSSVTGGGNADGNVLIGVSASASLSNLFSAITLGSGSGTTYAALTTANPSALAQTPSGTTMVAYAIAGGTAGNSLSSTTTVSAATWTGSTLAGGTAATSKTATITGTSTVGGANASRISSATINRTTGALSITFAARTIGTNNGPGTNSITVDYSYGGSGETVTDNGAGAFSATTSGSTVISGTVNYTTGALSITFTGGTDLPYPGDSVTANYSKCLWGMAAANNGEWAQRMQVILSGDPNTFVYGTQSTTGAGTYGKFNVQINLQNSTSLVYESKESYDDLVFNDATDTMYFPDVLNNASSYITITDNGALAVPASFAGISRDATMGTGDGATTTFTGTLANAPIVKTSLGITYTPTGTARTLVADVNGKITGTGLDTTKTNTVNYTTGVFTLNFLTGGNVPANTTAISAAYISMPTTSSVTYTFTGGSDGTLSGATFDRGVFTDPTLQATGKGMYALDAIDEVMQLAIPDFAGDLTVSTDQITYAEDREDIFVILSTPKGMNQTQAKDFQTITLNTKTNYAAMYWPWIKVTDPLNSAKTITAPPQAWVAGVIARTDQTKNVSKAPAGVNDGKLLYCIGLETNPSQGDRDTVSPVRINSLINTTQTGKAVWGARTMSATNDEYRYIGTVRMFQFVEKSVRNSTYSYVFESINSSLYTRVKTTVDSFLNGLFNAGYFAGNTAQQAYFVICDDTNNPPDVVDSGEIIVTIGIAPVKPAEFVVFQFGVKTLTS